MNKNKNLRINSKIVTLGVVVVILLINLFVTLLVEKYPIKIDLTTNELYNLSDETKDMLKDYDTSVDIYFIDGVQYRQIEGNDVVPDVLKKYAQYSDTIEFTAINSDQNLTFGTKYLSDEVPSLSPGMVILDAGNRFKVFHLSQLTTIMQNTSTKEYKIFSVRMEQKINTALKFISGDTALNAYLVSGHNEIELMCLNEIFTDYGYTVNNINLSYEEIPENADLVVINSPTVDYTAAEIAKLDNYLQNSGRAYISLRYVDRNLPEIFDYLASWGFRVDDEIAIENHPDKIIPQMNLVVAEYAESEVVSTLANNKRLIAYEPYAKTIRLLFAENNGIKTEAILKTSEEAYSTADFDKFENTSGNTGEQVISAIAVKQGETRDKDSVVYLSGTSALMEYPEQSLANNGLANADYITAVLSKLQGDMSDYSIMPKYLSSGRLFINQVQFLVICGIFVVLLPLVILIYGIVVWFKRRNL